MGHYDRERNFDDARKEGKVTQEEVQELRNLLNSLPNKKMHMYMEEGGTARTYMVASSNPDLFKIEDGFLGKEATISLREQPDPLRSQGCRIGKSSSKI